jgi:hypothetical protein
MITSQVDPQRVDQLIDGGQGIFFRQLGHMRVTGGGDRTGMAEQYLNMSQT